MAAHDRRRGRKCGRGGAGEACPAPVACTRGSENVRLIIDCPVSARSCVRFAATSATLIDPKDEPDEPDDCDDCGGLDPSDRAPSD